MHTLSIGRIGTSEAAKRIAAAGAAYQAARAEAAAAAARRAEAEARQAALARCRQLQELDDGTWARRMVADWSARQPAVVVTSMVAPWRRILDEVCAASGVTAEAIVSRSRTPDLTAPRLAAYYRIYAETTLSTLQIGRLLDRDHSSVLHGIRIHAARHGLPMPRAIIKEARHAG